jgi:hypothetical protein
MKFICTIFFMFLILFSFSQKKRSKCKLVFDKELGVEVYDDIDSVSGLSFDDFDGRSNDFAWMLNFDTKGLKKTYPLEQRIDVTYIQQLDGSVPFVKVISPRGDKELDSIIKKRFESVPKQPGKCWCKGKEVPGQSSISFRMYPKTNCKKEFDKELGIAVYKNIDSAAKPIDAAKFNEFFNAEVFKDIKTSKKYPDDQMVKIAFMINVDGTASLIKVLEPKNDKEITNEAQVIVNFIPPHKPCKCGTVAVPCNGNISFPLYNKKK